MKAATEEVNKTLENAGQKISFEGNAICLTQVQLNDMPVLGMLTTLHFILSVRLTVVVSIHYAHTCSRHYAKYFACVVSFDRHSNSVTRDCYYFYIISEETERG